MTISEQQITSLFIAYFNRAPAKNGYDGWVADLDNGVKTYEKVSAGFIEAPEFKDTYGVVNVADDASLTTFVTAVYQNVLGREGSEKGIADQVAAIKAGGLYDGNLAKFMAGFTASAILPFDPTDAKWDALTDEQKAAADTASDKINNKMLAADYFSKTLDEATHINGAATPEAAAAAKAAALKILSEIDGSPESLAKAKEVIDEAAKDPATAMQTILDALLGGSQFLLTTEVDNLVLTNASDTITGESATIGENDKILDTSITDHDVMNITLVSDMKAISVNNVEEINVDLDTLGGTVVDADNIDGAETITVSSTKSGFSGQATIANLGDNGAMAGAGITNLTVTELKDGLVDTGTASKLNLDWVGTGTGKDVNLKINGDVELVADSDYDNLIVEVTADAVLDISSNSVTNHITKDDSIITGDGNLTLKVETGAGITGRKITNDGTGELTIEIKDDYSGAAVDLTKIDSDKLILDAKVGTGAATKQIIFNGQLDATAKVSENIAVFEGKEEDDGGGSLGTSINLQLLQAANGDKYGFKSMETATIDAQKGGTIALIDEDITAHASDGTDANIVIKAGKDLTVTDIDAAGQSVQIDAATTGNITFTAVQAASIVATLMEKDFTMNQYSAGTTAIDEDINILGGKAKNSITTSTTTKSTAIKTQDGADTITAGSESGKLTIDTAGGDDKVLAIAMTTSTAKIDLGDGKDIAAIINGAGGNLTLTALAGDDNINIDNATAGTMTISTGADKDTVNVGAGTLTEAKAVIIPAEGLAADTANITINTEAGDDLIKIMALGGETIAIDGGDGTDTVSVTKGSDATAVNLTLDNIEHLKIDDFAEFKGSQLHEQTFEVSSGTSVTDVLRIELDSAASGDSAKEYDFSQMSFDNTAAHSIEHTVIDASNSATDNTIIGVHNSSNYIILDTEAGKEETVTLFADSMGTEMVAPDNGANATVSDVDIKKITEGGTATEVVVVTDVAVIENFVSATDSIALGSGATATNYDEVDIDGISKDTGIEIETGLSLSITKANTLMSGNATLEFVYAYNSGTTDSKNNATNDAFLLWDSDGDHQVDSAISFIGLASADGNGLASADIIAG